MASSKATGASALLGVAVDAPSDLYAVGRPGINMNQVGSPTGGGLTVTASVGDGNLTGSFCYRYAFGSPDGALTAPGAPVMTMVEAAGTPTPIVNDLTASGTVGTLFPNVYTLTVTTAGGTDKFDWTDLHGNADFAVSMVAATPVPLGSDGVEATFAASTGHSLGDTWTLTATATATTVTSKNMVLTTIGTGGPPTDKRVIERSDDGGATWAICGTVYDNTTATFTDSTVVLDKSKNLPKLNQTGANYGFIFLEPDSFGLEPEFSNLKVVALLGTAGSPRAIPGNIKIAGTPKSDLRPADMLPILLAGAGVPDSYTHVAGEPTQIATWAATTGKRNPRTISALAYQGSSNVPPNFLYQIATDELDFTFADGKIESIAPKFTGTNYGTSAPAGLKVAGDGGWPGAFAAIGQRYDADPVYTMYVNDTSKNQTKGGLQYNDAIELADQNGLYLGADVGSNRQPFLLVATAPLATTLHVGDIYELLPTAAIPGVGSAPYSGVPARFAQGPRFTDAHITLYQDGNVIEATSGTLKMMWPKKAVSSLCAGARTVIDMPNEGFFGANITIARYLDATTYRQIIRTDSRAHINIALVGERIPVNPGVLSTYRESLILDFPQVVLESVKAPVPGQVLVVESISAAAEQPDD